MEGSDISFFCQAQVRLFILSFFQAQLSAGMADREEVNFMVMILPSLAGCCGCRVSIV